MTLQAPGRGGGCSQLLDCFHAGCPATCANLNQHVCQCGTWVGVGQVAVFPLMCLLKNTSLSHIPYLTSCLTYLLPVCLSLLFLNLTNDLTHKHADTLLTCLCLLMLCDVSACPAGSPSLPPCLNPKRKGRKTKKKKKKEKPLKKKKPPSLLKTYSTGDYMPCISTVTLSPQKEQWRRFGLEKLWHFWVDAHFDNNKQRRRRRRRHFCVDFWFWTVSFWRWTASL